MTTKAEVIAAIDAALTVANNLVDQTALVTQLQADLQTANQTISARDATLAQFKTFRDAVVADANARGVSDAAQQEGKNLLDAAAGLPA